MNQNIIKLLIDKYNQEFKETLSLQSMQEKFSLPSIKTKSKEIYADNRTAVYIILYFFGSPELFNLYRLMYALYECQQYDKGLEVYEKFLEKYSQQKDSIVNLINIDPEWVISQFMFIMYHELAHYTFASNEVYKELYYINCERNYKKEACIIRIFNKRLSEELKEEISADAFAFNQFESFIEMCKSDSMSIAVTCASAMGCVYFLEYANRVNELLNPNVNGDFFNRTKDFTKNVLNAQLRIKMIDILIRGVFEQYSLSKDAKKLYKELVLPRVKQYNEGVNTDLYKYIQPYHRILLEGGSLDSDQILGNRLREKLDSIENELIEILNTALRKHDSPYKF